MHLVMRSSKAKGAWSFRNPNNEKKIRDIVTKFSKKHGVKILSLANVGNHLHFHIKLSNRFTYVKFIRAVTAAIAMAVTKKSRWNVPIAITDSSKKKEKFWDYRPFTSLVDSFKQFLNLRDYIRINVLEGFGYRRNEARFILAVNSGDAHLLDFG